MAVPDLNHPNAKAYFNQENQIVYITYTGVLSADASTAVYDWLHDVAQTVGIENMYGEIFDFRDVTEFMPDNLMSARSNSRRMNMRQNVKKLPVAMIVKDFYQEEILRGPMQNVKENKRKTVVRTMDDAEDFLNQWHAENTTESEEA